MQSDATTVDDYLAELEPDRKASVAAVRDVILENLPDGYEEVMQYGMISYIVPTAILAETYNGQPLMYAALASQKRYMSLYLTNVYGDEGSAEWFRQRYAASGKKLNMGKSCVRFRKLEDLPLDVVGEAIALTPMDEFLEIYRASRVRPPQVGRGTLSTEQTRSTRRSRIPPRMEAASAPYFQRPVTVKTRNPAPPSRKRRAKNAVVDRKRRRLQAFAQRYSDGDLAKTKLENRRGGVAERLNAPVLKTGMPATASRVRIPPPPPTTTVPHHPARSNWA